MKQLLIIGTAVLTVVGFVNAERAPVTQKLAQVKLQETNIARLTAKNLA